ncbi:MAG: stage III sporulation protein AD [Bacillota bacterium]|nr:stage III sporulation protein AD [Bacillota bacterium]
MDIARVVAFAFIAVVLVVVLRQERPELAMLVGAAAGAMLVLQMLGPLGQAVTALADLAGRAKVERFYLDTVLRVIGVAYLAEFGSQICRDAGEGALASKVELAGKVLIMVFAVPVVTAVVEVVLRLLP